MTENTSKTNSNILQLHKNQQVQSLKTLVCFQQSSLQLKEGNIKAKLQNCLYQQMEVSKQMRKETSSIKNNQKRKLLLSQKNNSSKNLQNSQLPLIKNNNQKLKTSENNKSHNQILLQKQPKYGSSFAKSNGSLNQFLNTSSSNQILLKSQRRGQAVLYRTTFESIQREKILLDGHSINSSSKLNTSSKRRFWQQKSQLKQNNVKKYLVFPPKIKKRLYESGQGKALPKQNRYFCYKSPQVDPQQIDKLGLYESSNRFRKQQMVEGMKNLSPKIEKKQLQLVKVCKQKQLFLTRPKQLDPNQLDQFFRQEFVVNQINPKRYFQTILTQQLQAKEISQNDNQVESLSRNEQQKDPQPDYQCQDHILQQQGGQDVHTEQLFSANQSTFFEIKNYAIMKNYSYLKFKAQYIEKWGEIQSSIAQIIKFLKELKMNSSKFKADHLLGYWSGRKLSTVQMQAILKINRKKLLNRRDLAIESVLNVFHAKNKMKSIIKAKQKRLGYMKWVCDRIIGIRSIRKQTEYKVQKAYQIHQKVIEGSYSWDVQIYLSSFSENQFVRNTTQYMESFQNMFTHMWKQSSKHMILVIPTINSQILEIYQDKMKIKRSITLICPEFHELFPPNMSLAGSLLFSYDALNKIKQLIKGKNAVIIPGKFCQPKYQLLISEFLRAPLVTSLLPRRDLQFQKQIFCSASLSVLPYISIRPLTNVDEIIERFAKLILYHKQINNWVFKINGQFGGRGLATFCIRSSKVLKSILTSCKDTIKPLQDHLRRNLKLKLKINFENSLFMFGDYLQKLSEKGGIIEQQKQNVQSYEISFFIQNKYTSLLVSCFKSFSINYSNKAYLYQNVPNHKISAIIPKMRKILEINQYLGYVSINMIIAGNNIFGIQIKPYLTHLSSVQPFIRSIQSKRQLKINISNKSHNKMQNQLISSTLRNQFIQKRKILEANQNNSHLVIDKQSQSQLSRDQSNLLSNYNLCVTEMETVRPNVHLQLTYLFIPNIIMTDVPIPKKAEFIQSIILQSFNRRKYDILDSNLVVYLSNGLSLNLLIIGKQMKKLKKTTIEAIKFLSEKTGTLKIYCGKNEARDVFQFGDIIKAVTQIKS